MRKLTKEGKKYLDELIKKYNKTPGVIYDINERWEKGIEHHPKSVELYEKIEELDFLFGDDFLTLKSGGDGDNGEQLMYLFDIFFEEKDQQPIKPNLLDVNYQIIGGPVLGPKETIYQQEFKVVSLDSYNELLEKFNNLKLKLSESKSETSVDENSFERENCPAYNHLSCDEDDCEKCEFKKREFKKEK